MNKKEIFSLNFGCSYWSKEIKDFVIRNAEYYQNAILVLKSNKSQTVINESLEELLDAQQLLSKAEGSLYETYHRATDGKPNSFTKDELEKLEAKCKEVADVLLNVMKSKSGIERKELEVRIHKISMLKFSLVSLRF